MAVSGRKELQGESARRERGKERGKQTAPRTSLATCTMNAAWRDFWASQYDVIVREWNQPAFNSA